MAAQQRLLLNDSFSLRKIAKRCEFLRADRVYLNGAMKSPKHDLALIVADVADLKAQLSDVNAALATLVTAKDGERASFTLEEFRHRHKLSESQYHKLRREGRGPRLMSTGDVGVRVSIQADKEWVAEREAEAVSSQKGNPG
jgi:hypothetical protein